MQYVIWPVAKNPNLGRFGPEYWQDWYRSLKRAVEIQKQLVTRDTNTAIIVLADAISYLDKPSDAEVFLRALRELGARNVVTNLIAYDTISELEATYAMAQKENAEFVVISTFAHYLRVWWLLKAGGITATHHIVFGLPRWREMLSDAILTFLFPIVDLFFGRQWFRDLVSARRKAGKSI